MATTNIRNPEELRRLLDTANTDLNFDDLLPITGMVQHGDIGLPFGQLVRILTVLSEQTVSDQKQEAYRGLRLFFEGIKQDLLEQLNPKQK